MEHCTALLDGRDCALGEHEEAERING